MIRNAPLFGADQVIFDLEDGVAINQKDSARILVRNALKSLDFGDTEVTVRINALGSPSNNYTTLAFDDCPGIDTENPNITSVSITNQNRKIGEDGTIFINIDADTENNDYTIVSGNVEGFAIHTLVRVGDLQLQASFTVTENNINILATDDVDVISLQVQDNLLWTNCCCLDCPNKTSLNSCYFSLSFTLLTCFHTCTIFGS